MERDEENAQQQVDCAKCGTRIPLVTAQIGNGLCQVCYAAAVSEAIDKINASAAGMPIYQRNPFETLWLALIKRVSEPSGFESLSTPEKLFFAAAELEAEVNNGGLYQYFFNSSADHYDQALEALREIRAEHAITTLNRAKDILFPSGRMPVDVRQRRNFLEDWADDAGRIEGSDVSFFVEPTGLRARLITFAIEHGLLERGC